MTKETESLATTVLEWIKENKESVKNEIIQIIIFNKGVEVRGYPIESLQDKIHQFYLEGKCSKPVYSKVRYEIFRVCSRLNIEILSITILDFLKCFPTQSSFSRVKAIGEKSVEFMLLVINEYKLIWPKE